VRGVVRKASNIITIQQALSNPQLVSKLEFAVVEDMTVPNAFHHLFEDISYVIHVASPLDTPVGHSSLLQRNEVKY